MKSNYFIILTIILLLSCSHSKEKQLYLLVGQSNMAGRGSIEAIDTIPNESVFMFTKDNQWVLAKEPLHFDKPEINGVGPGLAFGKEMAEGNLNAEIYLIPCAVGGSSVEKWQKGAYYKTTGSYPFDDAIARTKEALKIGGQLKGIIWHQGEADSNKKNYPLYKERLKELMQRFRTELNINNVPIVVGELGRFHYKRRPYADSINKIINMVPEFIPFSVVVSSEGLTDRQDSTHFNSSSYRILGQRYAIKMIELQNKGK